MQGGATQPLGKLTGGRGGASSQQGHGPALHPTLRVRIWGRGGHHLTPLPRGRAGGWALGFRGPGPG